MYCAFGAKGCDVFLITREAHIICEANITPEGRISFRRGGTHRSKTKSTALAVLFVLRRVDRKDADVSID